MYRYSHNHHALKQGRWIKIFVTTSLLVIVAGLILVLKTGKSHPPIPPSTTANLQMPKSVKPSQNEIDNYHVTPDLPRYIFIPSIGVAKTRVIKLGLEKNNQIASPDNIYDVGWYSGSAKPGQAGAVFMYGHVSSWTANGTFYNLKKLKQGDEIIILRGDGKTLTYQVRQLKIYPANSVDMQAALSPIDSSVQGLNLMTCTGKVIPGTSEFNQRLLVFASRI